MDASLFVENPLFSLTTTAYGAAAGCYAATWRSARRAIGTAATALTALALAGNAALILQRWLAAGRPPFKSLFESLVFLSFCVASVYLTVERLYRTRAFGVLATSGAAAALLFALLKWDAEIVKLPPALQSGWFIPHVVVYFVGYGALFVGTAVACVQLARPKLALRAGSVLSGASISLEDVSYDALRFGFALLTVGLFLGSVWAKSAWGDYWVWDPKENWSLASWLIYGAYLHLRRVRDWRGRRAAWLAIAGFAVVVFTYLGMELLPTAAESAHVYQG